MTFDISTLAVVETSFMQLKHPATDEPLFADAEQTQPVGIKLYSTGSKQYRSAINAMQNRTLKRNAERNKKPLTATELREENLELLASISIEAAGFDHKGVVLDNKDAFRDLYADDTLSWIKEQVDAYLGDIGNFIQA